MMTHEHAIILAQTNLQASEKPEIQSCSNMQVQFMLLYFHNYLCQYAYYQFGLQCFDAVGWAAERASGL